MDTSIKNDKSYLAQYLKHKYWVIGCVIIFTFLGFLYLRSIPSQYTTTARVKIAKHGLLTPDEIDAQVQHIRSVTLKNTIDQYGSVKDPLDNSQNFQLSTDKTDKHVLTFSLHESDPQKGAAFINKLVKNYNAENNVKTTTKKRNESHLKDSLKLLDDQIAVMRLKLASLNNKPVQIPKRLVVKKKISEKDTLQLKVFNIILPYLEDSGSQFVLIPYAEEITDPRLNQQVTRFNELQLTRRSKLRTLDKSDTVIQSINKRLFSLSHDIKANIGIQKGLIKGTPVHFEQEPEPQKPNYAMMSALTHGINVKLADKTKLQEKLRQAQPVTVKIPLKLIMVSPASSQQEPEYFRNGLTYLLAIAIGLLVSTLFPLIAALFTLIGTKTRLAATKTRQVAGKFNHEAKEAGGKISGLVTSKLTHKAVKEPSEVKPSAGIFSAEDREKVNKLPTLNPLTSKFSAEAREEVNEPIEITPLPSKFSAGAREKANELPGLKPWTNKFSSDAHENINKQPELKPLTSKFSSEAPEKVIKQPEVKQSTNKFSSEAAEKITELSELKPLTSKFSDEAREKVNKPSELRPLTNKHSIETPEKINELSDVKPVTTELNADATNKLVAPEIIAEPEEIFEEINELPEVKPVTTNISSETPEKVNELPEVEPVIIEFEDETPEEVDEVSEVHPVTIESKDKTPEKVNKLPEVEPAIIESKDETPEQVNKLPEVEPSIIESKDETPEKVNELLEIEPATVEFEGETPEEINEILAVQPVTTESKDETPEKVNKLQEVEPSIIEFEAETPGEVNEVSEVHPVTIESKDETPEKINELSEVEPAMVESKDETPEKVNKLQEVEPSIIEFEAETPGEVNEVSEVHPVTIESKDETPEKVNELSEVEPAMIEFKGETPEEANKLPEVQPVPVESKDKTPEKVSEVPEIEPAMVEFKGETPEKINELSEVKPVTSKLSIEAPEKAKKPSEVKPVSSKLNSKAPEKVDKLADIREVTNRLNREFQEATEKANRPSRIKQLTNKIGALATKLSRGAQEAGGKINGLSDVKRLTRTPLYGTFSLDPDSTAGFTSSPNPVFAIDNHIDKHKDHQVILLTSAAEYTKASFSKFLAQKLAIGKKTVLVDLNLKEPHILKSFELPDHIGVVDFIEKPQTEVDSVLVHAKNNLLYVIGTGISHESDNPAASSSKSSPKSDESKLIRLINHPRLASLLKELKTRFDYVILDIPSVDNTSELSSLMPYSDLEVIALGQSKALKPQLKNIDSLIERKKFNNPVIFYLA